MYILQVNEVLDYVESLDTRERDLENNKRQLKQLQVKQFSVYL